MQRSGITIKIIKNNIYLYIPVISTHTLMLFMGRRKQEGFELGFKCGYSFNRSQLIRQITPGGRSTVTKSTFTSS